MSYENQFEADAVERAAIRRAEKVLIESLAPEMLACLKEAVAEWQCNHLPKPGCPCWHCKAVRLLEKVQSR